MKEELPRSLLRGTGRSTLLDIAARLHNESLFDSNAVLRQQEGRTCFGNPQREECTMLRAEDTRTPTILLPSLQLTASGRPKLGSGEAELATLDKVCLNATAG